MQPATGPSAGVGVVSVVGDHLLGDALCGFGSSGFIRARCARLVKGAPARAPGIAGVEIGTGDDGQQFSTSGAVYEYIEEAIVVGIAPRRGKAVVLSSGSRSTQLTQVLCQPAAPVRSGR